MENGGLCMVDRKLGIGICGLRMVDCIWYMVDDER